MVITAEDEAEACLLNTGKDLRCCGNGLGAIDGLVRHEYLPDAVGGQIFGNVRQRLRELRAMVHDDYTDLAVFHFVPAVLRALRQIIDCLADLAIRIAVILMVAKHMDQIHAAQRTAVDRIQERTAMRFIHCHIVDGIAGLNTEVIASYSQLFQRCGQICCVACLNVAQDEEVGGFRVRSRHFKALRIRPSSAITHLIVVGGVGCQIGKRYFVAPQRIAAGALHKGLDRGGSIHRSGTVECGIGGILYLCLCRRVIDLGKPGNALGSSFRHTVGENAEGLAAVLSRSFTDDHALVPGAAAAGLFGIEGVFARRVKGFGKCALHVGAAQLLAAVAVHLIDNRTGNRLAVGIRYGQFGRHPSNGLLAGELIACRHGDNLFCAGEGISRSGFGTVRDGVAALRHRAFQHAVRCGICGNRDDEITQLGNIVVIRVLHTGTHRPPRLRSLRLCDRDFGKSLCQSVLIQCQRIVAAEWLDRCARKILRSVAHGAEIHRQLCLRDRLASVIYDSKDVFLADLRRLGLGQDINGRLHPLCVLHTEGACFGGHVAVEVLEPDSERMRAVTERHALEVEGTVIDLQLAGIVRTVQQHADTAGIDAGGVFIGQLAVGIDGVKGEITAVQHGRTVARQFRARGGLGDRFQHRAGHVVGIRAVNELKIIDVKITGTSGAVLGGGNTHRITAAHINGHLEGRNICFHPNPSPTCQITKSCQYFGVEFTCFLVPLLNSTVVLNIRGCSVQLAIIIRSRAIITYCYMRCRGKIIYLF